MRPQDTLRATLAFDEVRCEDTSGEDGELAAEAGADDEPLRAKLLAGTAIAAVCRAGIPASKLRLALRRASSGRLVAAGALLSGIDIGGGRRADGGC